VSRDRSRHPKPRLELWPYCLSLSEAADYLGISYKHMYALTQKGIIQSVRIGDRRMLRRVDLERFCDRQIEGQYRFDQPQTIAECRIAAEQAERQSDTLKALANRSRDDEAADFLFLASRAYTQLACFFRWNGGLGEFAPTAM
jgi:excisionase family DNA binding protein